MHDPPINGWHPFGRAIFWVFQPSELRSISTSSWRLGLRWVQLRTYHELLSICGFFMSWFVFPVVFLLRARIILIEGRGVQIRPASWFQISWVSGCRSCLVRWQSQTNSFQAVEDWVILKDFERHSPNLGLQTTIFRSAGAIPSLCTGETASGSQETKSSGWGRVSEARSWLCWLG